MEKNCSIGRVLSQRSIRGPFTPFQSLGSHGPPSWKVGDPCQIRQIVYTSCHGRAQPESKDSHNKQLQWSSCKGQISENIFAKSPCSPICWMDPASSGEQRWQKCFGKLFFLCWHVFSIIITWKKLHRSRKKSPVIFFTLVKLCLMWF